MRFDGAAIGVALDEPAERVADFDDREPIGAIGARRTAAHVEPPRLHVANIGVTAIDIERGAAIGRQHLREIRELRIRVFEQRDGLFAIRYPKGDRIAPTAQLVDFDRGRALRGQPVSSALHECVELGGVSFEICELRACGLELAPARPDRQHALELFGGGQLYARRARDLLDPAAAQQIGKRIRSRDARLQAVRRCRGRIRHVRHVRDVCRVDRDLGAVQDDRLGMSLGTQLVTRIARVCRRYSRRSHDNDPPSRSNHP